MKHKDNFTKLLNLHYLKYANKTVSSGDFDMPALFCNIDIFPDYIALYSNVNEYRKTDNTAVAFFQYDNVFDGKDGIFWAIYFNDTKRLNFFKNRFKDVKYIITPDYSILGDIHFAENIHRLFRARIVAIWFIVEIGAIVIPNVSFADEQTAKIAIAGLEHSSVIAISTKGHMQNPIEKARLERNIGYIVESLNLKAIILYDVCGNNDETKHIFSHAQKKGIEIVIPPNSLKERNYILRKTEDIA